MGRAADRHRINEGAQAQAKNALGASGHESPGTSCYLVPWNLVSLFLVPWPATRHIRACRTVPNGLMPPSF